MIIFPPYFVPTIAPPGVGPVLRRLGLVLWPDHRVTPLHVESSENRCLEKSVQFVAWSVIIKGLVPDSFVHQSISYSHHMAFHSN